MAIFKPARNIYTRKVPNGHDYPCVFFPPLSLKLFANPTPSKDVIEQCCSLLISLQQLLSILSL